MYYVGIDSGGTKTAFTVIDKEGNIKLKLKKGTGHYFQIGFDGFKKLYIESLNEILEKLDIDRSHISYVFMGIPGYGEVESDQKILEEIIAEVFKGISYTIGNDVESGWAGSLACEPGINIVCGTGSIAIGVDSKNKSARSGGWGEFIGDEASAYWVAKKSIEIYSKQSDYRLDKTIFYEIFKKELNLTYDFELIDLLHNQYKLSRTKVAKISIVTSKIALERDKYALEIFKEAAYEIFLMINSIIKQLDLKNNIKLSYTGGIFNTNELILEPLKNQFKKNNITLSIVDPILSPSVGSALFAYKLEGNLIQNKMIENLKTFTFK